MFLFFSLSLSLYTSNYSIYIHIYIILYNVYINIYNMIYNMFLHIISCIHPLSWSLGNMFDPRTFFLSLALCIWSYSNMCETQKIGHFLIFWVTFGSGLRKKMGLPDQVLTTFDIKAGNLTWTKGSPHELPNLRQS